jgi:hypothetical protein
VVGHTTEDGVEHRTALAEAWAARFELGGPVRRFTARKGQRHLSGLWWSATTGGHVGFESWLERDHVMLLDFDAAVVGIASQPFWLRWCDGAGKEVLHVPDFFARRADGSAVVTDCRPAERRPPARRGQIRGHSGHVHSSTLGQPNDDPGFRRRRPDQRAWWRSGLSASH